MTAEEKTNGNFELVRRVKLEFTDVILEMWRSKVTGLTVVHLDYEAPLVNGYFVVRTEIFNDSGCPHTLEHLVFMGSEKYPYKGIIDHFANRGFSNGTNAWTDTDHTAYTASTAGAQGFLQLLPIYVDHILYPTLTKAGYTTEVHHIDAKGEDSGVVYSEMQGRENTSGDLMQLKMQQEMYPKGSAYRSETGGLMEALRVLSVEQIRDYHAQYYVPHNLSLVVAGSIAGGTSSLLSVLNNEIEPTLIAHKQSQGPNPPGWNRPFLATPTAHNPPLEKSTKTSVDFPEKDESLGEIIIAFKGPAYTDFLERKALDMLGTYLTNSATAPLMKEYVEIADPLCTYVYFAEDTRAGRVEMPVYVGGVPVAELDGFDERLVKSLKKIVVDGLDMERMKMIIDRDERQFRSKLESAKGDTFSGTVISDFLYGPEDGSALGPAMDDITLFASLRDFTPSQWTALLAKYYIDAHRVTVLGRPSAALVKDLRENEEKRVKEQRETLGEDGLKRCVEEVEEAKKEHEKEIPKEVLEKFPVPSVDSIEWIKVDCVREDPASPVSQKPSSVVGRAVEGVKSAVGASASSSSRQEEVEKHVRSDGSDPLPFFVQYDHAGTDSCFVSVHAMFSLEHLPSHLRPYVALYLASFFSLPIYRSSTSSSRGTYMSHEQVVDALDAETVSYEISLGAGGYFSEMMRVSVKVEVGSYEKAIGWIYDLIYGADLQGEVEAIAQAAAGNPYASPPPTPSPAESEDGGSKVPALTPNSTLERLSITLSKLAQSLPELKRDGSTVMSSLWSDLMYSPTLSTGRAVGLMQQMEWVPKMAGMVKGDEGDRKSVV